MVKDNVGEYAAVAVTLGIIALYVSAFFLHVYGCWIIGGFVGVIAFFMPPIPALVAIGYTLGLI